MISFQNKAVLAGFDSQMEEQNAALGVKTRFSQVSSLPMWANLPFKSIADLLCLAQFTNEYVF